MEKQMITTFMDFCAGIGAGRMGLERNGLKCVAFSEIDNSAVVTYKLLHRTDNEDNFGDLTKIDYTKLPNFDLLIAGFPCQTFSVMGQRKGFEDDRGQIIHYLLRIMEAKGVPCFILENVKGLVNHDKGRSIAKIKSLLEEAGYQTSYKVLNSLEYGVPQMRERVYFIGIKKDLAKKNKKFEWPTPFETSNLEEYLIDENNEITKPVLETFQRYLNNKYNANKFKLVELLGREYTVLDTRQSDLRIYSGKVPTLRTGRQGILYVRNGKLRTLTGYESLLLQGFGCEFADRVKGKISNSNLLAQAGNAMSVSVIEALGESLLKYMEE